MKPDTASLIRKLKKLYVPIIADILDEMGVTENVFSTDIRPIFPKVKVAGSALTVRTEWYPEFTVEDAVEWHKPLIETLESTQTGDFYVVSAENRIEAAAWGELMSNAAQRRGAQGAVVDGAVRDVPRILTMKRPFPVFAKAFNAADAKGRLKYAETNVAVECAGVKVEPSDIIFGDLDGVVCIPRAEARTVIERAHEKLVKEDGFRRDIRRGRSVSATFAKYKTF